MTTHDREGTRTQYFGDDSTGQTLQDLVERERLGLEDDYDESAVALAGKQSQYVDAEDFTLDDAYVAQAATGVSREATEHKRREKAVRGE